MAKASEPIGGRKAAKSGQAKSAHERTGVNGSEGEKELRPGRRCSLGAKGVKEEACRLRLDAQKTRLLPVPRPEERNEEAVEKEEERRQTNPEGGRRRGSHCPPRCGHKKTKKKRNTQKDKGRNVKAHKGRGGTIV